MDSKPKKLTAAQQRAERRKAIFLRELERSANVAWSARQAGWANDNMAHYQRDKDPVFAQAWEDALAAGIALLEVMSREKAIGYEEQVVYQGVPQFKRDPETGEWLRDQFGDRVPLTVKKYDSRHLELQLKRHHHAYRDRVQVDSNVNTDVRLRSELDLTSLTREERAALRPVLEGQLAKQAVDVTPKPLQIENRPDDAE